MNIYEVWCYEPGRPPIGEDEFPEFFAYEVIAAKSRGQARYLFTRCSGLAFTDSMHISLLAKDTEVVLPGWRLDPECEYVTELLKAKHGY